MKWPQVLSLSVAKVWLSILFSALLVVVVGFQTCIMRSTDKIAETTLYAQRPWVASVEPPAIIEPLVFDTARAHIRLMFRMANGGVSPALGATATPHLSIKQLDVNNINGNRDFILKVCTNFRNLVYRENIIGVLILPGEIKEFPIGVEALPRNYLPNPDGSVSAYIITCVDYRDQFGKLHGIGGINTFVTRDGHQSFKPEGTVDGKLQVAFFQVIY